MPLNAGTRLGPYEIVSAIGAGGMGEVYRARDTRLDRTVAIKVLPAALAGDPEFRSRFEREARAIAQLGHPHICALFDIGQDRDLDFLVLEYLEGETLGERLQRGPLPVDQSLRIALEICSALDCAHRAGIVHRDLKPGNVFLVRGSGASAPPRAKLLDFGLAKSGAGHGGAALQGRGSGAGPTAGAAGLTAAPTVTTPLTQQGTLLGTFQYMAPEQVEGADADARTDIWAFGCVLYEMLTGKKAFEGRTTASLIGAILKDQPALASLVQPLMPRGLDRIVKRCLAKDPADRWQTARDLLDAIEWAVESEQAAASAASPIARRRARTHVGWAAAAIALASATAAGAWWTARLVPAPPLSATRFTVAAPEGRYFATPGGPFLALSPDGSRLVFAAPTRAGAFQLFVRAMGNLDVAPLAGTEGGTQPFFSPDGQWVGFEAGGKLKKVPVAGGSPLTMCDVPGLLRGASWAEDDSVVFARTAGEGIWRVPAAGGAAVQLTQPDGKTEINHLWPEVLPGGRGLLFTIVRPTSPRYAIGLLRTDTGERRVVLEDASQPRYLPGGRLLFSRGNVVLAAPFDLATMAATGAPAPVVQELAFMGTAGVAHMAVSPAGTLAYAPGTGLMSAQRRLAWVDRAGAVTPIPAPAGPFQAPRLSPDGARIALDIHDNPALELDVWIYHLARRTLTRFTFGAAQDETGLWSPDGSRIAFTADRPDEGGRLILWKRADGGGTEERVATADAHVHLQSWSPDGEIILLDSGGAGGDLWLLRVKDRRLEPFLQTPFNERDPALSPDGRWVAYVSDESGRNEVYVQPFPGPGGRWQISTGGGREPRWNPNGRELFYRNEQQLMAVDVRATGDSLETGMPALLFEGAFEPPGTDPTYDVGPAGRRFLMLLVDQTGAPPHIVVVQNWFAELGNPAGR